MANNPIIGSKYGFLSLRNTKNRPFERFLAVVNKRDSVLKQQFVWAESRLLARAAHPLRNGSGLALRKDLAVSLPLLIPMAELDLLRWDRVPRAISNSGVTARTSILLLGAVSSYVCQYFAHRRCRKIEHPFEARRAKEGYPSSPRLR